MQKSIWLTAALLSGGLSEPTAAEILRQEVLGTFGERAEWFMCPYACTDAPDPASWQEITTVTLANPTLTDTQAQMFFLDGGRNAVAEATTLLSALDLDVVNVCRTLEASQIPVPPAGMIMTQTPDPPLSQSGSGAAYGWAKNLWGQFPKTVNEPFEGTVRGGAQTECRLVGPGAVSIDALSDVLGELNPGLPDVAPVLIEQTAD